MVKSINKRQIDISQMTNPWDFGNDILYNLCRDNLFHDKNDSILTKVLFIGRIYAAAIERRKNKNNKINDSFYIETVVPAFKKSKIDVYFSKLNKISDLTTDSIKQVLETHHYLTKEIYSITKLYKRSFSSKYLHFHFPHLFFIYDNRAVIGLREFTDSVPDHLKYLTRLNNVDKEYSKYFCKCYDLKTKTERQHNRTLTNRQLDKILIDIANKRNTR